MDLEQRIAHLERRSQVLTGLLGFCTLLLVTGVLTAARRAWQVPDELVTRSLRVVGKNGKNQASLAATPDGFIDRKSTRLNSSHVSISYAVFCLKKKKKKITCLRRLNIKEWSKICSRI